MKKTDTKLGLECNITRRDFIHNTGIAALAMSLPLGTFPVAGKDVDDDYYPPTRTGMRGSHPGAFEYAHLCPDLPEEQKQAQKYQVKRPLLLTNVLLRSSEPMDKLGITVNRWPHGYSHDYLPKWPKGKAPHQIASRRFGNIVMANSDAYTHVAIDEAFRAVSELG